MGGYTMDELVFPEAGSTDEVKIRDMAAEAYPDSHRVRVFFSLSPSRTRPSAVISLLDSAGEMLASVDVISIFQPENEITLHIPAQRIRSGEYAVTVEVFSITEQTRPEDPEKISFHQSSLDSATTTFLIP
jgi:hypothetical protein